MSNQTKVTIQLPAYAAARLIKDWQDNPKAVKDYFNQFGIPIEDIMPHVKKPYEICPACSGVLGVIESYPLESFEVLKCRDCGGICGEVSREVLAKYVRTNYMQANTDNPKYFDFIIKETNQRVHGWFDPETKKVVQFG